MSKIRVLIWVLMAGVLSGCANEHPVQVEDAWVREILPTQAVTAGYFRMTNTGANDDRLMSVTSPAFETVELHDMSVDEKGVMRMRKTGPIELAPGATVTLKRGGYHLMLIEPRYRIAAGNDIPLTLTFEKSGDLTVAARVRDE